MRAGRAPFRDRASWRGARRPRPGSAGARSRCARASYMRARFSAYAACWDAARRKARSSGSKSRLSTNERETQPKGASPTASGRIASASKRTAVPRERREPGHELLGGGHPERLAGANRLGHRQVRRDGEAPPALEPLTRVAGGIGDEDLVAGDEARRRRPGRRARRPSGSAGPRSPCPGRLTRQRAGRSPGAVPRARASAAARVDVASDHRSGLDLAVRASDWATRSARP